MTAIIKLFQFLVTLASLVASVEAIIRLAKFAWSLWLALTRVFRRKAMFAGAKRFRFARA